MENEIQLSKLLICDAENEFVAIKPICQGLGIDHSVQIRDLKKDEILGSVVVSKTTTGSDGKNYSMQCLPIKYVFGWLFTISPKKVKPEAAEVLIQYRRKVYDVLWEHFAESKIFLKQKERMLEAELEHVENAKRDFSSARSKLKNAEGSLKKIRSLTFEEWKSRQMSMLDNEDFNNH
tara:strand:+ start:21927 stop:22460 length:534 start_codon:yes stop_codon:yes gene_type:complete